jgi:two-component system OmpR family sensor kinase
MRPLARRPLRVQLSVFVVVLLALGMLVSSLLATAALRGYLLDRVDQQLAGASRPFTQVGGLTPDLFAGPAIAASTTANGDSGVVVPRPPNRFYVAFVSGDGTDTGSQVHVLSTPTSGAVPDLPSVADLVARSGTPFDAGSTSGSETWRVLVTPTGNGVGWSVAALPLADVQETVSQLVLLQAIVGIAVVLIGAGVGYVVVRRSLRPLDEMASVAHEIAEGDLSRRVPERPTSAEVEELSRTFNVMVTRIEQAFAAQLESETQARSSEERMRRFVADAGHELRTPLTSIRGYAELIEQGAAPDPDDALARIQAEAARMGTLVDDLLQLARLDQQRPLERAAVDLADVARAAVDAARVGHPDREFALTAPADGPWVLGDEQRLRQVVDNLLSNAVRYSPSTEPIAVRAELVGAASAPRAQLVVVDRGLGLSPDESAHVFERLYRTDEARTRVSGGSGLGLAIVQSIVTAHGGEVFVESAPGDGSTFGFRLPLAGR